MELPVLPPVELYRWAGFVFVTSAIHTAVAAGAHHLYSTAHRRGWWRPHAIEGGQAPPPALVRAALFTTAGNHLGFPLVAALLYPVLVAGGLHFDAPSPSLWEVVWQLGFFALLNDTVFYWTHRLLHWGPLFRAIHHRHHRFRHVRPLSVEYAHPVENALNILAFVAGPALLGPHVLTWYVWITLRLWETQDAHSGFALPLSPSRDRHAFHHRVVNGNFGSMWSPWDWLMGTNAAYLQWKARDAGPVVPPHPPPSA